MNQDIYLKFSAFVYHVIAQIWIKNFGQTSNSLPATAHFGQNFGRLKIVETYKSNLMEEIFNIL